MKTKEYSSIAKNNVQQMGLIVLQSDVTIEDEFRFYLDGLPVSLMVNRIPFENDVTVETLKAMEQHIDTSMSLFPIDAEFDYMGYGCTSGALHIGDQTIADIVQKARSCTSVSNPMQSAIAAFNALNANKIGYLAPYSKAVSQSMVDEIERRGVSVVTCATFDEPQDKEVGRISPESIKQACYELAGETDMDALFVSCTNMKCASIIADVEAHTGIPMVSSNQALAWNMLRSSSSSMPTGKGSLFQCQ